MTRIVSVCATLAILTGVAHAETGMLPGGAKLTFEKFYLKDADGVFSEPPTPDDRRFYLNFAHCACSKAMAGDEQTFQYEIKLSANTMSGRPAEVWVGTACDLDQTRNTTCRHIVSEDIADIDVLATTPKRIELSLFDVMNGFDKDKVCTAREGDALVWLLVDSNGDGTYDYTTNQPLAGTATSTEVTKIDTQAPPLPTNFRASSGEEAIEISWTPPTGRATDIFAYQALCLDENDEPVATKDPKFQTTLLLCGIDSGLTLMEAPADGADGTPLTTVPRQFMELDTRYVCGDATGTASSLTIGEVDNGKPYKVALLVIDHYGNVDGVYFNRTIVPKPVTDLWEDLHDRNSAVDGGCLLSQTYGEGNPLTQVLREFRDTTLARTGFGRALTRGYYNSLGKLNVEGSLVLRVIAAILLLPLVVLALLWHYITLPGLLALILLIAFRKRLRKRALAFAILLVPSIAAADDFEPYWDTSENDDASLIDVPDVTWHAGIRVGPYIPEIDLQAGQNALTGKGPYEAMFGTYYLRDSSGVLKKHERSVWQVLPMLDVERVLWDGFGQVLVGGTIGYMQKSAYAYVDGTTEDQPMRERSKASRNTFKLIPAAATISYRFTTLDDLYGIPVIPYVRGGLSYYAWWIKGPSGNVSKVCEEMAADMSCAKEDKAYGGSLGFQGSVGIAVRAERIDSDAAMSMRNGGIMHAGFYAELQYAKVDGFGDEHKLSVGDNTWFAGVDFEF